MTASGEELRYSPEHLWFRRRGDGARVGVTERVSRILTWVNTVELPPPGARLTPGADLATIDSQKAEIAIPAPVPLAIVAVNEALIADPMLVRMDPRGRGWLVDVSVADESWQHLLTPGAYERLQASE